MPDYIAWFDSLGLDDVPRVGGKTASLAELHRLLRGGVVEAPDGFALTAEAYRDAVSAAGAWEPLRRLFVGLDCSDVEQLARTGEAARRLIYDATGGAPLREQIVGAYRALRARYGPELNVAVRSSATAEDLPTASFAGQHDSFLHVGDEAALVEACRRCFASLFTDRAIVYRVNNGFDHFKVALSVAVMTMVSADEAASGVLFTLDTETGFRDVVYVTGAYGLGENIVQGRVGPDEFYVHKPTLKLGFRAVLRRSLGSKQSRLAHSRGDRKLRAYRVARADRESFCLTDAEVLDLAEVAVRIEDHYSEHAGAPTPMDIEWAKDGPDGRLYVLQARPETVASRRSPTAFETYNLKAKGAVVASGKAVGEKIATGRVRLIRKAADLKLFQPGEVLVATSTSPIGCR